MKRIELFIGTQEDKDGNTLSADVKYYALERTRDLLSRIYGGFTEFPTTGGWKDDHGRIITESGLKYEVWTDDVSVNKAEDVAGSLRSAWHQTAVLLSVDGQGKFI